MLDPALTGKVVLITGANHGIGAAAALALAGQGAHVFITYYRPPAAHPAPALAAALAAQVGGPLLYEAMQQQSAERIVQQITAQGGRAAALEADLAEAANIPRLFDACEAQLGPVDVLINNHTHDVLETFDPARVTDEGFGMRLVSADEMDRHFQINARGYALLMREYVQRYLARGAAAGRIINLSTDAAHKHEGNVSYAASKHAIESLSRSAAAELGRYGVTVNVVAPGPIQTGYIEPAQAAQIAAGTPLGRVGVAEDVADVIVFLASRQAHWLTGQLLYAGGGWRMPQ